MDTLAQEQPTKLLQTNIRPSVYRRLRIAAAARDSRSIGPVVDELLDAALPADPNESRRKRSA